MSPKLLARDAAPGPIRAPGEPAAPSLRTQPLSAGAHAARMDRLPWAQAPADAMRAESRNWPEGGYRVVFSCHLPDERS